MTMFANVVGHERVRERLARALQAESVHPGYLFAGPPGVGKHRVALEFLRAWLCLAEPNLRPCGECDSCRHVGDPTHRDLRQITFDDKKKSIGVEQIRDLGSWLTQSPAQGKRKAAVVDPADAMTTEAANALLKTLEEPPPGRVIVLIARRTGALPPTVRSRCQQVWFGALTDEQVAEVLRRNGWPAQSSRQAAALAEGSPGAALERDGQSWQQADESVRALFTALAAGERGAALVFAEGAGDPRERALASLRSIIGYARLAARRRLGDRGVDLGALPPLVARMGPAQIDGLLAGALEVQRRLEGERPPNAKLALSTLLVAAADAGARP